ncbi:MAG: hypothetical protein RL645_486 [Actinomycetota bacterium]|jgi:AcrR family transcriptional regulator
MSQETPHRLKQATEELLLTKGEAGITLRDITEAAGANVASVAYHFKSKDKLIAIVFGEAIDEVTAVQSRRVQALSSNHTLRELIEVWLHPLLSPSDPDEREAKLWRLIQRGAAEKAPGLIANMSRSGNSVETILIPKFAALLPHLRTEELLFRHNAIISGLAGVISSPIGAALAKETSGDEVRELTIAWIMAGLSGPGTTQLS